MFSITRKFTTIVGEEEATQIRSGYPTQIRDGQSKILECRRGKASNVDAEGKFRTAGSTFFSNSVTPFELDRTPSVVDENSSEGEVILGDNGIDVSLSLDEFFRRYTSEDNASFSEIMEKVNRKRKERFGHLLEGEKREDVNRDNGEPLLTPKERVERLKGLMQEINETNTRIRGKMLDSRPKMMILSRTPSPMPEVDEFPFITWGEIEGTPLRLEAEDTPLDIGGSADRRHFKIPGPPSRDVKAHTLSR
ncbi:hypothetical protein Nepgr_000588 [Nepenthes gracilis]|uniref:Uncharacterized protein n=1 Tax=Nepenthes gracilis TaxID=150966 RepID=A0AAD3P6P3_NEPGR|nr:hypothetical protein Nepgr_000588 [Nepenthes gracilis]